MLTRVNDHKLALPEGAVVHRLMFDHVTYKEADIFTNEFPLKNVLVAAKHGDFEFDTFEDAVEFLTVH